MIIQRCPEDVPIIGFLRAENFKDILLRAKLPQIKSKHWCRPCKVSWCQIWKYIIPTRNFTSFSKKRAYEIRPENINISCRSKNVVFFISCKTFHKQYTENSAEFRAKFYSYRWMHRNCLKRIKVKQELFHTRFADDFLSGNQSDRTEYLRKREPFWQYELDTFPPNGPNKSEYEWIWVNILTHNIYV